MPKIEVEEFAAKCANMAADVGREGFTFRYEQMRQRCESPIEEIMLAALLVRLNDVGDPFLRWYPYALKLTWPCDRPVPVDLVLLCNQAIVGDYRADFLLGIWSLGERRAIVIECDGHDYHERTKAQAKRDRRRDRWMTLQDVIVMRFTGSEIHADPDNCADQVADQFEQTYFSMRGVD